jgi:hypothetical protein
MTISPGPCLHRHGIAITGADKRTFSLVERAVLSVGIAVASLLIRITEGDREPHDAW